MSIVTLKKKTGHKYNNSSVGHNQFSLNGGHRSQGYIGQTMLSRSILKTPMKGSVAIGNGGSNGKYNQAPLFTSDVSSMNDPNSLKKSVLSTNGMIKLKYRWIQRPMPFISLSNKVYVPCTESIVKDKILDNCSSIRRMVNKKLTCAEATGGATGAIGTTSIGKKRTSFANILSSVRSSRSNINCPN